MDAALMALALRKAHEEGLRSVLDQARYTTEEAAHNIKRLLVPVLQRWGIGLHRGGVMAYPKVGSDGLPSMTEVRLVSDEGYALKVVHPEIYELLCTYNQVLNKYVYNCVEGIPVGLNCIPWVWVTSEWGDNDEPIIDICPCPHNGEATRQLLATVSVTPVGGDRALGSSPALHVSRGPYKEYYGPINKSLYSDVLDNGGDMVLFLNTLPQYEVDSKGAWVEISNWFREVKG